MGNLFLQMFAVTAAAAATGLANNADNRDGCMVISSHMHTLADLNHNMMLERCEWSYACVVMTVNKGDSKKTMYNKAKKCVMVATKHLPAKGVTLKQVAQACAKRYPTLKGSPLQHD